METPLVQRHSLLICHCHLLAAVVEIDKVWQQSGGKDEDTISSTTFIIDVTYLLQWQRETECGSGEVEGKMKTPLVQ